MPFSAALCRGLIEAFISRITIPGISVFSAALCRGLIEARPVAPPTTPAPRSFSAALCRGLIEAYRLPQGTCYVVGVFRGFMPRPH